MIDEGLFIQLFDKIPQGAKLGIFGLNNISSSIFYDIKQKRKDIEFCGFINNTEKEDFLEQKVYSFKEILNNNICDFVIITTVNNYFIENLLDIYEIPFLTVNDYIIDYYSGKHQILNDKTYNKVIKIYNTEEDKKLFDLIFRRRKRLDNDRFLAEHYSNNYKKKLTVNRTIRYQYLEKINKEKVKIMFDLGFNCGFNAAAYNKLLVNLQKIYAFEAIYDYCKKEFVESFIPNDKVTIVKAAVGGQKGKTKFYINQNNVNASLMETASSFSDKRITDSTHKVIEADTVTIDGYCSENNIKPDFIKTDIEGAELLALKGGINTIINCRPQLAISIYHCDSDFINIPIYLDENLENYVYRLGHYSPDINETVLYAVPEELV